MILLYRKADDAVDECRCRVEDKGAVDEEGISVLFGKLSR